MVSKRKVLAPLSLLYIRARGSEHPHAYSYHEFKYHVMNRYLDVARDHGHAIRTFVLHMQREENDLDIRWQEVDALVHQLESFFRLIERFPNEQSLFSYKLVKLPSVRGSICYVREHEVTEAKTYLKAVEKRLEGEKI